MLGVVRKMQTAWCGPTDPISYTLKLGEAALALNPVIGKNISLKYTGRCFCIACGRAIKKTFQQGYCFPCTQKLAETDTCIIKPELCHHHLGTCRDENFAQSHCFIPHSVYLANCGSAKVGITRSMQKFTRWADQGATNVIELAITPSRKIAGHLEVFLKQFISDRTNWRKMLSNQIEDIDLVGLKTQLLEKLPDDFKTYAINGELFRLTYPALAFPQKIISHDLDKTPTLAGVLMGIKGQYVIFENAVMNLRKYQGYEIEVSVS